jgi:hypothetical protein
MLCYCTCGFIDHTLQEEGPLGHPGANTPFEEGEEADWWDFTHVKG